MPHTAALFVLGACGTYAYMYMNNGCMSLHVHACNVGYAYFIGMLLTTRMSTSDCSVLIDTWLAWNGLTCQLALCSNLVIA